VINTLRGGGISSVGYARAEARPGKSGGKVHGLIRDIRKTIVRHDKEEPDLLGEDRTAKVISLVRRAMLGRLTLPCEFASAERALVLVAGPPDSSIGRAWRRQRAGWKRTLAGWKSGVGITR